MPEILKFTDVDLETENVLELPVGTTLMEIPALSDVDSFARQAWINLAQTYQNATSHKCNLPSQYYATAARKARFHGRVLDLGIQVVEPDLSIIDNLPYLVEESVFSFMTLAHLKSSAGSGIYRFKTSLYHRNNPEYLHISMTHADTEGNLMTAIRKTSQISAVAAEWQSLLYVYTGGGVGTTSRITAKGRYH